MTRLSRILYDNIIDGQGEISIDSSGLYLPLQLVPRISATRILAYADAQRESGLDLVNACCDTAASIVDNFQRARFALFALIVGAAFSSDMQQKFKEYSILRLPSEHGLITQATKERVYSNQYWKQHVGILQMSWTNLPLLCEFQANRPNIAIFCSKKDYITDKDLFETAYKASIAGNKDMVSRTINWGAIAAVVCSNGDAFIRVGGAFDDPFRALSFLFDSRWIDNPILTALGSR